MSQSDADDAPVPKTTLPNVQICLRGFSTENEAREAGDVVRRWLWIIGTEFDLQNLDGVTVAYDYDAALAELDRGYQQRRGLTRTHDDHAIGLAMTPAVLRNGQVRAHIVLHAAIAEWLKDEANPQHRQAQYTLVHEAAHAYDLGCRDRALPGITLQQQLQPEDAVLLDVAEACWTEYAACRLSARVDPEQLRNFENTFCSVLPGARERGNECIRRYRRHGIVHQVTNEITSEYGNLAKYASYLLGHVAGLGYSFSEAAPKAHGLIQSKTYFAPLFQHLTGALDTMWAGRYAWTSLEAYDPLKRFARELLRIGGIELSTRSGGLYVDVP